MAKKRQTKADNNSVLTIVLVVAAVFLFSGGNLGNLTGNIAQRGSQTDFCIWDGQTLRVGTDALRYDTGGVRIGYCNEVNGRVQITERFCPVQISALGNQQGAGRGDLTDRDPATGNLRCKPMHILNSIG